MRHLPRYVIVRPAFKPLLTAAEVFRAWDNNEMFSVSNSIVLDRLGKRFINKDIAQDMVHGHSTIIVHYGQNNQHKLTIGI